MLVFSVPSGMSARAVARRCLWLAFCQSQTAGMGFLHTKDAAKITEEDLERNCLRADDGEYLGDYVAGRMVKLAVKYDEKRGVVSMQDNFRPDYQSFAPVYRTPLELVDAAVASIRHDATGVSAKQEEKPDYDIATHPLYQFFQTLFDNVEKQVATFPLRVDAALHFWNHELMASARGEFTAPCGGDGCDCHKEKTKEFDYAIKSGRFEKYIRENPEAPIIVKKYHEICKHLEFARFICQTYESVKSFNGTFLKKAMLGDKSPFVWGCHIETNGDEQAQREAYRDIGILLGAIGIPGNQWEHAGSMEGLGNLRDIIEKGLAKMLKSKSQ